MAQESANGSKPADAPPSGNDPDPADNGEGTPFQRFERLTRKLVSVPKTEVNQRLEQAKRKKRATPARPS